MAPAGRRCGAGIRCVLFGRRRDANSVTDCHGIANSHRDSGSYSDRHTGPFANGDTFAYCDGDCPGDGHFNAAANVHARPGAGAFCDGPH